MVTHTGTILGECLIANIGKHQLHNIGPISAWAAQVVNHFHGVHYFKTMTFHSLVLGYVTAKRLNWSDSA